MLTTVTYQLANSALETETSGNVSFVVGMVR